MDLPKPSSAPAAGPSGGLESATRDRAVESAPPPRRAIGSGLSSPERLRQELAEAQKMEAIGQLIPGIAHELNNPLAAIVAFSELIRRDARLPDDLRHDAELLVEEAHRIRRIAQNLLEFARHRPPERHATELRPLVASVIDLQAYAISSHGIEVEVEIEPDVPSIALDRAQMQQVLLNLTLNAIQALRAAGHGGRIAIHGRLAGADDRGVVRLSVADDGPGVPDELADRIFAPFFTTRGAESTGLGLPVSADIVAAHGGQLRHEPGPGNRGATFVIELPLPVDVIAPRGDSAEGSRRGLAPDAADERERRPRILVLDDEPSIRRFLSKALENAGFAPVIATTGQDAIAIVREAPVDGILSDHRMSGMNGTDVYEALVAIRPELRDRFVFMSGDVLDPALRAFAEANGIALLAKPFDLASVGRTVRDLLARRVAR